MNEKGLKFGQYQPDSPGWANNNNADNYDGTCFHVSNLCKIKKPFSNE